jgi:predicted amidophosphoribosyltransferase
MKHEAAICLHCLSNLPRLHLHDEADNPVEKLFWGRVDLHSATAYLNMPRNGITHRLIHRLKYHGDKEVGERLGALFALELQDSARMRDFDVIVTTTDSECMLPNKRMKLNIDGGKLLS